MPRGYSAWRHNWTPADEARLAEMIDDHRSYAEIAKALGRTECAIRLHCKRRGMPLSKAAGMTINRVGRLLGVDPKAVSWWCNERWLKAHDIGMHVHSGWVRVVEMDDLLAFLERERYWHLWRPERIRDSGIREWATELREGVRFLTVGEVAERLCCTVSWVSELIRRGRLPAVRRGNWLVRERDCRYPEHQSPKGRKRAPSLTERECALVRRYWGKWPATTIARFLGRSAYSKAVYSAAERMGLPRLGPGYWQRPFGPS